MKYYYLSLSCIWAFLFISPASYADRFSIAIQLTSSGFQPQTIHAPAGKPLKIMMTNQTAKVAELESYDMKFEKIAVPFHQIAVFTGPLKPGSYTFFDDYSANQVSGSVIVEDKKSDPKL
jgi:heme/copper-type cytochrome/quinol oxidase subunit 2